jgi:hypothetical protein
LIAVVRPEPESNTTLPETMLAWRVFVFLVKPFTALLKLDSPKRGYGLG